MFLNLWEVGTLKDEKRRDYYYNLALDLNTLPVIDYERVNAGKQEYLREIFAEQGSVTVSVKNTRSLFRGMNTG